MTVARFVSSALLTVGLSVLLLAGCGGGGANEGSDPGDSDDLTAPAAPSGLQAAPESGTVRLSWDDVSGADTYRIYRSTSSGTDASGSTVASGVSSTTYTDEGLDNGTTYFYAVTAVASEGGESAESGPSGEAKATPFAPPSGLEGTSGDSQIKLTWEEAKGAETYDVYRDTSSMDGAKGDPLENGIGETSYTDTDAENGTKYYYRVTSVNPEEVESPASGEVEKTPFSDPPDQP